MQYNVPLFPVKTVAPLTDPHCISILASPIFACFENIIFKNIPLHALLTLLLLRYFQTQIDFFD